MGVPLYIYDDEPLLQGDISTYPLISEDNLNTIKELSQSRRRPSHDMSSSFESSIPLNTGTYDLQGMERVLSEDGASWIFYRDKSLIIYDCGEEKLIDYSNIVDSPITCVDCYADDDILWFALGGTSSLQITCCFKDGRLIGKEQVAVSPIISRVFACFLPQYVIIMTTESILVYGNALESLFSIPASVKCDLIFPNLITYDDTSLSCWNLVTRSRTEFKPNLRPDEAIVSAHLMSPTKFLLETNQRYISLSPEQQTISHKTSPSQATFKNDQLYVVEHHLYATSLAVYSHCALTRQWQLENYYDLISKFNIKKVDALIATENTQNLALTLLIDEFIVKFQ